MTHFAWVFAEYLCNENQFWNSIRTKINMDSRNVILKSNKGMKIYQVISSFGQNISSEECEHLNWTAYKELLQIVFSA